MSGFPTVNNASNPPPNLPFELICPIIQETAGHSMRSRPLQDLKRTCKRFRAHFEVCSVCTEDLLCETVWHYLRNNNSAGTISALLEEPARPFRNHMKNCVGRKERCLCELVKHNQDTVGFTALRDLRASGGYIGAHFASCSTCQGRYRRERQDQRQDDLTHRENLRALEISVNYHQGLCNAAYNRFVKARQHLLEGTQLQVLRQSAQYFYHQFQDMSYQYQWLQSQRESETRYRRQEWARRKNAFSRLNTELHP